MAEVTIGSVVKVDHPITCLNPKEYFRVDYMRYDVSRNKTYLRGEDTCWFNADMILDVREHEKASL